MQVNFSLGQVKVDVWWFGGLVTLTSVVLLVLIFKQKQFKFLRLQDEQNNGLEEWINFKSGHT